MIFYSNGHYMNSEEPLFTIENRAFHYGDGVFETMIYRNGSISFFEDHMIRLRKAMTALELSNNKTCSGDDSIKNVILNLKEKNNITDSMRIKLMVHRAWGGLYSPVSTEGILSIIVTEYVPSTIHTKDYVVFSDDIRNHYHKASAFKLLSSGRYVLAGLEMKRKQAKDIIITDIDGNLSECLQANLFWIRNNELFTPGIETGCIEGVIRKQIQRYCEKSMITFHTSFYPLVELEKAELVFAGNVGGLTAFEKIERVSFKTTHPILEDLRKSLFN